MHRTKLGGSPNEGARQAWIALERLDWTQSRLRAEIKERTGKSITSGALVRYLYCERRPKMPWAEVFETVLGVPQRLWHEEPKRPIVPPAARLEKAS